MPLPRVLQCAAFSLLLLLSSTARLHAAVRLPAVLSDHAVLQRDRPIHLWGWAEPGAKLTLHFHAQTVAAEADRLGKWSAYLAPERAGGPYTLAITGDGPELQLADLLVGDVWFASGQSNMEMPLAGFGPDNPVKDSKREIAAATNPRLRLLVAEHKGSDLPLDDQPAHWTDCTPETARKFSAIAYFFGREIAAREDVPVGLVDSTWGGTPADSWVSLDTLGTDPSLFPAFASRARFIDKQADAQVAIAAEQRETAAAKAAGQPAPHFDWHPDPVSWQPAGLYNGMIAPFTPLTVKGFLWYQGETNSGPDRAPFYAALMRGLITDWRQHFAQGELPFLFVQISSFSSPAEQWGMLRDQQRRTLAVAGTSMAVSLDVGLEHNVHPPDKQTVAARLALAARATVYGERIPYSSPNFREATTELRPGGLTTMRVWFDHAEGLTTRGQPAGGFELAGPDHHFIPAEAHLEHDTVVVSAPALPHPTYVRYGWTGVVHSFLYNAAGLPASTFTSEPVPTP